MSIYFVVALCSVLIADVSQIILTKAAVRHSPKRYKAYLTLPVILAYGLFVLSTVCSVVALRKLPLSFTPVWQSMGQVFVVILSYIFLHEKLNKNKLIGVGIIILGILIFSI